MRGSTVASRKKGRSVLRLSVRPIAEALERRYLLTSTLPAVPNWVEQGPGPITGSQPLIPPSNPAVGGVGAIVTVPGAANNNIAFIGAINGGVWRTTNLLASNPPVPTWTPLTDQMPSLTIGAMALDPLDGTSNTLYVGIGGRSSTLNQDGGARLGIYVSTNALSTDPAHPVAFSMPTQHPEIFTGVNIISIVPTRQLTPNGQVILLATDKGLWRSDNSGKNWLNLSHPANAAKFATNLPVGAVSDLVADPSLNTRYFAAIPGKGVYVNTDPTGLKWAPVANAPLNAANSVRIRLAMHSTGVLFAAIIDSGAGGQQLTAVFSSANQGANWNPLGAPNPAINPGGQGNLNLSIAADPAAANNSVVYIGGDRQAAAPFVGNLARYAPATGWTSIVNATTNATAPHADSRELAFANDGSLLESDDGGIYRLVNPGNVAGQGTRQWQGLDNNLRASEFRTVAYDPISNVIIGGAQDNGVSEQIPANVAAGNSAWQNVQVGDGAVIAVDSTTLANSSIRYDSLHHLGLFIRRTVNNAGNVTATSNVALNVIQPSATVFTGTGLDDATSGGFPTSAVATTYTISIDGTGGTDTFKWRKNGGVFTTGVAITGGTQFLADGVSVAFGATTGHALNDQWVITIQANTNLTNLDTIRFTQPWVLSNTTAAPANCPVPGAPNPAMRPMLIGTRDFLYESCDGGDTLRQIALPVLPAAPANRIEDFITSMAYGGANQPATGANPALFYLTEDVLNATTFNYASTRLLRREVAGGPIIVAAMTGYTGGSVRDLVIDSNNWNTLYLIDNDSVWRSTNKGQSFVNLTANLPNLTRDLRTIEFIDPNPAVAGDEVILVGGDGGVFRRLTTAGSRWTEFGAGLANAVVKDLHYDATGHLLLAATLGRGAWTVPNVEAQIAQPAVLNVTGTITGETITLSRDKNNPLILDVVIQPKGGVIASEFTTFQLSTIDQISVKGGGGGDSLVIDESNGPISAVIPKGISWDGGNTTRSTVSKTTAIPASSVAALEGGMDSTADLTDAVASNTAADAELPFVDASPVEVLSGTATGAAVAGKNATAGVPGAAEIGSILKTGLLDVVTNYLGVDSTPTVEELVGVLQSLSRTVGDLNFDVDPSTVLGGIFSTEDHDEMKFDLVFKASRTVHNIPIKLGAAADSLGLHLDASAKVDVTASMTFDFSFGVILDPNLDVRDAFFIQPHSLSFGASVHASPANFGITVGFLKAGVQNGTIDLDGSISIHFANFEEPAPFLDEGEEDDFKSAVPGRDPDAELAPNVEEHLLTQSDLQGTAIGDLISSVDVSGSLGAKLPVVASLGGVVIPGTPTITVTDPDLFDGNLPQISTDVDFDKLLDFDNVTPATILGLIDQFGNFLEQFRGSSVFSTPVPFTNKTLGDLLDMRKALLDKVGNALEPQPSQPSFSTAQDLADKLSTALGLPPSAIAAKYDPATKDLTYHIKLTDSLQAVSVPIAFNADLGSLAGINTSSTLSLNANAGLEFTLGINLAAPIATVTATADSPSNGKLGGAAHLSVQVGTDAPVDITIAADATNTNIDDLISDINAALNAAGLGSSVTAGRSGNKLTLATKGLLTPAALMVMAPAGDPAVNDLHFATSQGATNTLAHQFFIKDASLNGLVTLNANDIDASARFGFLEVGVVNGHGAGTASITAGLKDPGTVAADGKITLDELFGAVSSNVSTIISSPNVTGSANLVLPLTVTPNILGASAPANPTITVNWTDITDPSTLAFSYNGDMSQLLDFEHLSYLDIINALLSTVDYLSQLQQFSFLNQKLPLINKSVAELADVAQNLTQKTQQSEQPPANSLQTVASKLEQAMGLPPGSIKLKVDGKAVRLDLTLQTGIQQNLAIDLDLAALAAQAGGVANLQGVGNLIDVSGTAKLNVAADATLNLALGVDLTDPTSPKPFLYDSTAVALDAKASGSNLSFTASVGPLGLFINNGTANLDGDGNPATNDSASFTVGLIDDNGDGRHYFNELGTDDAKMTLMGQVHATLPVFFPTSTQSLGNLTLSIGKLSDIPHTIQITAPNISAQFGLVDLLNNLGAIPDGLDKVLGQLQDAMDSSVFGSNLPLIGSHLKDGARFIERIRTDAIEPLSDTLQDSPPIDVLKNALFDNLGPNGLGVLGDIEGNGTIDKSDVQVVVDPSGNQVQFNLLLRQTATLLNTPLDFDIGLPALGLSVDGGVSVKLGYDFHFSFGVSKDDGFYFGTNAKAPGTQTPIPELTVQLDAGIPDLQATGRLGFLQLSVQDDATTPTHFLGKFDVDLKDPDNDGKLTFDELAAGPSTSQIVAAKLNAQANVDLNLMATFGGSSVFPSVSADFAMAWAFTNADTAAATGSFGNKPSIQFKNIRLNAGEFFSNFARPILGKVQQVLKPIEPVIDILTAPLPVLSDLPPALAVLDTDGNGAVSLAELAPLFSTDYDLSFISSVAKTIKLINSIPTTSPSLFIDLGQFEIGSDVRTDSQVTDSDLTNILQQDPESELTGQAKSFFDSLDDLNSVKGGGIAFPILQHPLDVFKLLLGQDINLFTYQMAPLMISYPMSEYFPIIGPLGVRLTGTVGATADFGFGYDTSGLREYFATPGSQRDPAQLLDGFYVSDRKNADGTGADKPEVTLTAGIQASGELNLAAATAGVGGGIFATIDFNLNDPDNDGKVRAAELINNFNRGPLCVFDLGGALFAGLNAYVTVLTLTQTFNIATVKLLDFDFSCPAVPADPDPILATDLGSGVLRLNMGPSASARQYGDTKDEDENYKVTPGSTANSVTVQAYGFTQEYQNVSRIVADGGAGSDTINIDSGVLVAVSLLGGVGDDTLLASTGPATLDGGAGNDQLRGGTGNDMLLGGDGDDTLLGGAGNDMLVAGTGVNLEIVEGGGIL